MPGKKKTRKKKKTTARSTKTRSTSPSGGTGKKTRKTGGRRRGVSHDQLRRIALDLPEVEESSSYGTLAFKVRGKFLARLHQKEPAVVVRMDFEERDARMRADPDTFYITDHYLDYPAVLVKLSLVRAADLREVLWQGWQLVAPPSLRRQHVDER